MQNHKPMTQGFIKWLETNRMFYVDEVRKWLREYDNAEISFSKFVELLNQKVFESQQPIPQDINEAEVEKYARLRGWEVAQALLPELQQLREEVKNLKNMMEFIEKDRQAIREKLETTELIAKGNQNSYNAAKGKIEQQKSQIEQLYGKLEYAAKGIPRK